MANRAAAIRAAIAQRDAGAVVIERGRNYLKHRLSDGRVALDSTIGRIHLDDGSEIETALSDSTDAAYTDESNDALPYKVRVIDGSRRVWPRRSVPGEFIDLGRPEFQRANGSYAVIPWDSRERLDNTVVFRRADAELHVSVGAERLKMELVLLSEPARNTWRFPVSLTGLTRQGTQIISDADGSVVMYVAPFVMVDAAGVTRDVEGVFTAHPSYQGAYRVSPVLDGLVLPIRLDPTLDLSVSTGADDGYFSTTGSTFDTGASAVLIGDFSGTSYNMFARFTNVTVPNGATISANSYLELEASGAWGLTTVNLLVAAVDEDSPTAPTSHADANGRALTTATVAWDNVGAWSGDVRYQTPGIATVLQEIADRPGWSSGNALVVYVKNNGSSSSARKQAKTYNASPTDAPALHIEYTEGGGGVTHQGTASASQGQAATTTATVRHRASAAATQVQAATSAATTRHRASAAGSQAATGTTAGTVRHRATAAGVQDAAATTLASVRHRATASASQAQTGNAAATVTAGGTQQGTASATQAATGSASARVRRRATASATQGMDAASAAYTRHRATSAATQAQTGSVSATVREAGAVVLPAYGVTATTGYVTSATSVVAGSTSSTSVTAHQTATVTTQGSQ